MSMLMGFKEGGTLELDQKEGYVRTEYLNDEEQALIKTIAVANEGTLNVLIDKKKVYDIAEQYAAYGIRLLHDTVLSGEYGTYAKKLESELLQIFKEQNILIEPPRPDEQIIPIRELIEKGENERVEVKSSMIWDYKENRANKRLIGYVIVKTISAFMNSAGGFLVIGVDDNKKILGLANDFSTLKKSTKDAFELHFTNIVNNYLGKENRPYANIRFENLDGLNIAIVEVTRCSHPVFIKSKGKEDEFYVRMGNSSHPLNVREATIYIKEHWPEM